MYKIIFKGVEDPRLMNPYNYKPTYIFGTIKSGSTEEVIRSNHPNMYEYMKKYMVKNVADGIEKVKKRLLQIDSQKSHFSFLKFDYFFLILILQRTGCFSIRCCNS